MVESRLNTEVVNEYSAFGRSASVNSLGSVGSEIKLSDKKNPWNESRLEKQFWDLKKGFHRMQVNYEEVRRKLNGVIKKLKADKPVAQITTPEALMKRNINEMLKFAPSPHDLATSLFLKLQPLNFEIF